MKVDLKFLFATCFYILFCGSIDAQSDSQHSPGGILDTVMDRFGIKIPIGNIYIPTAKFGSLNTVSIISSTCQAGYFKLHFESTSIFSISATSTVACKVFEDLSNMIVSNALPGSVNIHCGSTSGANLAEASPYFVFPFNPLVTQNQGIIDGQVYKAIVSGTNPYSTLPLTLFNSNQIYHGFVNVATSAPWNFNLITTTIASNEYDLYTVILHEAMHSLGFLSLMRYDGLSAFTPTTTNIPAYNYYHRYDQFLYDSNNNPLLSSPINSCAIFGATFAPASSTVIGEGASTCTTSCPQDITTCSVAAKYMGSTTATVYTPYYFEPGSSLSHFEDMCSGSYTGNCTPVPSTPGYNNLYFTMANFTWPGGCYVKRHPKPEERRVLCDLGYSVNPTYGALTVAGSSINYSGGLCSPSVNIIGNNDGYLNNQFVYQVVALSSTIISYTTLLANDTPTTGLTVSCMELVTNNATFTPGFTDFSVTVTPGGGLVVLKYIPRNSSGQTGNATFVFINFVPPGCNSCGIVNNGGFEFSNSNNVNRCGELQNNGGSVGIDCWQVYGSNFANNAALLTTTLCTSGYYNIGVNTPPASVIINTVAIGASSNTNAIGMTWSVNNRTTTIMNTLNTPLVNTMTYQVSFWAINYFDGVSDINNLANPVVFSLATSTSVINPNVLAPLGFPSGLDTQASFTIPASTTWAQYTSTFVFTANASAPQIIFGFNTNLTASPNTFTAGQYYCFLDEISIFPIPGPNFSIPNNTICSTGKISNLAQFTGTTPGTFSGPGVSSDNNGQYYFNADYTVAPGVYGISFTYFDVNCFKTINQSIVVENCCSSPSIPSNTLTTVSVSQAWFGPMRIPASFTIAPGTNLNLNGEFLISPNVSITIKPYGQLSLIGAHLYGCLDMWKGIVVEDGGQVLASQTNGVDNLIEDAETAIKILYNTNVQVPLAISNTIFNKNYIDVDLANYPLANALVAPFNNCVFTCRDLPFSSSTWPNVSTASTGLRYANTNPATPLTSPYDLQNAPIIQLKSPHAGEHSHIAIMLNNVGRTGQNGAAPLTFYHADLTPSGGFNLYDAHDYFIKATNSNIKISNSVFQNTQTFSVISTQTVGAAIDHSCSVLTTYTPNSTIHNFELDMSSSSFTTGNRFYDCHKGITGAAPFSFKLEKASFRSTHLASGATSTAVIPTGQTGVFMKTHEAEDYIIKNNEFFNMSDAVAISLYPENIMRPGFPYLDIPTGQFAGQYFLINAYIHTISVTGNTFTPEDNITFSGTTNGYVKNAISVSSDNNNMTAVICGCTGLHIEDNQIYRALNGISLNSVNPYTMTCANVGIKKIIRSNNILLQEDNVFGGITQRGISFINSLSEPMGHGQRLQVVEQNTISVSGTASVRSNTNISLYFGTMNGAVNNNALSLFPTPHILCNVLSNANKGFEFKGWNRPASWRGNIMEDLMFGMHLNSAGHIGEQGDANNPIDNRWDGSWPSTYSTTNVDGTSDAANSKLWVRNNSMPYWPSNNGAFVSAISYNLTGNLKLSSSGSYDCETATYTLMNSALPMTEDYSSDDLLYIARNFAYRYLAINDSMKNTDEDLTDFYDALSGTSIDKFMQVEMRISERKFDEAQAVLNSLSTGTFNSIEHAYYDFYTLSLKYKIADAADPFSLEDLETLELLASECPDTKGNSVYQARALYQLITGQVFNSPDGCAASGARMALQKEGEKIEGLTHTWNIDIFPNPLKEKLTITNSIKDGVVELSITDLTGRIVNKQRLKCNGHTGTLDVDLVNGAYFITIKNSLNETVTKQILIAK